MTITLHLGVIDVPHDNISKKAKASNKTTGDVAEILEGKYHLFRVFLETHEAEIVADLEAGLQSAADAILSGAPVNLDPFGEGTSSITARMKDFLAQGEMEKLGYPGVPVKASGKTPFRKGGINHRLKHPYSSKNSPRQSFIDTGQLQASMKAWVDDA